MLTFWHVFVLMRSAYANIIKQGSNTVVMMCVISRGVTYLAGAEVAEDIRRRVQSETKLTCSVGIGPNGMLAKVASDINKPNGQYILPQDPASLKLFVQSLSLRKVPGIGKVRVHPAFCNEGELCKCWGHAAQVLGFDHTASLSFS